MSANARNDTKSRQSGFIEPKDETAPRDGTTVRVSHEKGTYGHGETTGFFRGGEWVCSEAFIDPHTMRLYWRPTHWQPAHPVHGRDGR